MNKIIILFSLLFALGCKTTIRPTNSDKNINKMDKFKNTITKEISFKDKIVYFKDKSNNSTRSIVDTNTLKISWDIEHSELLKIADKVEYNYEGLGYNLGVRTFADSITERWILIGKENSNRGIKTCRTYINIGDRSRPPKKFLDYREELISHLGPPAIDMWLNNAQPMSPRLYYRWLIENITIELYEDDFRGVMYKLDISKDETFNK